MRGADSRGPLGRSPRSGGPLNPPRPPRGPPRPSPRGPPLPRPPRPPRPPRRGLSANVMRMSVTSCLRCPWRSSSWKIKLLKGNQLWTKCSRRNSMLHSGHCGTLKEKIIHLSPIKDFVPLLPFPSRLKGWSHWQKMFLQRTLLSMWMSEEWEFSYSTSYRQRALCWGHCMMAGNWLNHAADY